MLPWVIILRFTINTAMRMGYSFLPAFARGAQISDASMGAVIGARDLSGLLAPLVGRSSDRNGAGRILAAAGIGGVAGLVIAAIAPIGLIIGFVLIGISSVGLSVSSSAWIGHAVAYERRGRAIGFVELSWGGAALLGLPLMGVLIEAFGWRAAPASLAIAALPVSLITAKQSSTMSVAGTRAVHRPVMTRSATSALLSYTLLIAAAQFVFLGHGLWLEDTYQLTPRGIGLVVFAAASMEVVATLATTRLTDALGKRRAILLGAGLMVVGMLSLALAPDAPLWLGTALLALIFLGFEFAVVSAIPLMSELDPRARATMVARATAASTVGRALISVVAVLVYERFGFRALMAVAAAFGVATMFALSSVDEPAGASEVSDQTPRMEP